MNGLVFLSPNKITAVPYTTSKVISDLTGVAHRHIKKQIEAHKGELKQFGLLVAHETESTGGRPEEITQLNEEQATLLITFLKNTEPVVRFKTALVREFYAMRTELQRRQILREQLKPIRHDMTDEIQEHIPDNKWIYKQCTDLAYKSALGKNAAQIRKGRGAQPHDAAVDYMTAEEIAKIAKAQNQIAVFVSIGMDYQQIKAVMIDKLLVGKLTQEHA